MEENKKITNEIENKTESQNSKKDLDNINIEEFLSEYNQYTIKEYNFVIGLSTLKQIIFQCETKNKYYQEILSHENINNELKLYTIESIYKYISNTMKQKKISITTSNNNIKINLFLLLEKENFNLDILLKEIEYENLIKQISEKDEAEEEEEYNEFYYGEESENNDKENEFTLLKDNDEEKKKNDWEIKTKKKESIYNMYKIYNIINKLKNDIIYLKNVKNINETKNNDIEEIKETINKMKNEINILNEENKKNKEEIISLKEIINNSNTPKIDYIKTESNDHILQLTEEEEEEKSKKTANNYNYNYKENINNNNSIKNKINHKKNKKSYIIKSKMNLERKKNMTQPKLSKIFEQIPFNNEESIVSYLFKEKYEINENNAEIDLTNKIIGDDGLDALSQTIFNNLQKLSLDSNNISKINPLSNMDLTKLQILNLDNNCINDINTLDKFNCVNLQTLWLNNNNIKDITVFERVKFDKLQYLYLNNNKIEDISVFTKSKLNMLQRLYLRNNYISDINCLVNINLDKLELIYLNKNNIDFSLQENKDLARNISKKIKYFSY